MIAPMSPTAQRYLHMLGTIFAVLAAIVLALIAIAAAITGALPEAAAAVAAVAVLVGYVVYAHRRTSALLKEESELARAKADSEFEGLSATALASGVSVRWRARTYVVLMVLLAAAAFGVDIGWNERAWPMLGASALCVVWFAKMLLARLAEPEVLHDGPIGIEDKARFGLIPWADIKRVFLHEYRIKGSKMATLSIGVRDPGAYRQRLGPLKRFFVRAETPGIGDDIRIQVQALSMAPAVLFRVIRAFHERVVPAGAIEGRDNLYMVDVEFAKLKQLMGKIEPALAKPPRASAPPAPVPEGRSGMHWAGRVFFVCLGAAFLWLAFVREPAPKATPMFHALSSLIFSLFAFWALWSAFFSSRVSSALGPEPEGRRPPASAIEAAAGSSWMVARRVLLYPAAVLLVLGGAYLLVSQEWNRGIVLAAAICLYAGFRAFTAARYGQGYMQPLSDARRVDAERRRRYGWGRGDDVA